jgi:hypothetical protein
MVPAIGLEGLGHLLKLDHGGAFFEGKVGGIPGTKRHVWRRKIVDDVTLEVLP